MPTDETNAEPLSIQYWQPVYLQQIGIFFLQYLGKKLMFCFAASLCAFPLIAHASEQYLISQAAGPTDQMLSQLEEQAKNLPRVKKPGHMCDFDHYLGAIDLIMLASQETITCRAFIKKHIIPELSAFNSIVDVGTGSGENTGFIAQGFKKVTLIDPEKNALDTLNLQDLKSCETLIKINNTFQKAAIETSQANLCVFAHVFYDIPQDQWIDVLKKAYASLAPNGIIFVVFNFGGSRGELVDYFKGTDKKASIDCFLAKVTKQFPSVQIFLSKEIIHTKSLQAMLQICNLFLFDAKAETEREYLTDYIEKKFRKQSQYIATMNQVFIKIKK